MLVCRKREIVEQSTTVIQHVLGKFHLLGFALGLPIANPWFCNPCVVRKAEVVNQRSQMRLHWPFCHVGMAESGAGDNKSTNVGVLPSFACIYLNSARTHRADMHNEAS